MPPKGAAIGGVASNGADPNWLCPECDQRKLDGAAAVPAVAPSPAASPDSAAAVDVPGACVEK